MLTYRPDSKPTVIRDTSHDLHLDQPNQLHAVTSAFLKKSANLP
jgi:pimeloyl-ACP methyl ester carboxylesterase